jgi:hypothetical protein
MDWKNTTPQAVKEEEGTRFSSCLTCYFHSKSQAELHQICDGFCENIQYLKDEYRDESLHLSLFVLRFLEIRRKSL